MEEPGVEFEKVKLLHCQSVINNVYKEVPKASHYITVFKFNLC